MERLSRPPQLTPENAEAFQLDGVVAAYRFRPTYPPGVAAFLAGLRQGSGPVLELGCGTGELARALAPTVGRVDALDISAAMIAEAQRMPGGSHPDIRWLHAPAEDFPLRQGYGLAVAGDALHWMDWDVLLPRLARELVDVPPLAILSVDHADLPWQAQLADLIPRYSTSKDWQPFDLIELLGARGLFAPSGSEVFRAEGITQATAEYVESFHARAALSRERMGGPAAEAFDRQLLAAVEPHAAGGRVMFAVEARIRWGRPLGG